MNGIVLPDGRWEAVGYVPRAKPVMTRGGQHPGPPNEPGEILFGGRVETWDWHPEIHIIYLVQARKATDEDIKRFKMAAEVLRLRAENERLRKH